MHLTDHDFDILSSYIQRISGIYISRDKQYLIEHRLTPLVLSYQCTSFAEFCEKIAGDDSADIKSKIIMAITTNETCFFRDQHPFDTFKTMILPQLGHRITQQKEAYKKAYKDDFPLMKAQILCIGASTGQEPYSIAMLIHELVQSHNCLSPADFHIMAVDISKRALEAARRGEYTAGELQRGLNSQQILRYFTESGDVFRLNDEIRQYITFAEVNITTPDVLPGMRFDVIFCRNILIYFDLPTKIRILERLSQLLLDSGFLILGAMESTCMLTNKFESIYNTRTILYRRRKTAV